MIAAELCKDIERNWERIEQYIPPGYDKRDFESALKQAMDPEDYEPYGVPTCVDCEAELKCPQCDRLCPKDTLHEARRARSKIKMAAMNLPAKLPKPETEELQKLVAMLQKEVDSVEY